MHLYNVYRVTVRGCQQTNTTYDIIFFFSLTTPEAPHMSEKLLTLFVPLDIVVEFSK